MGKDWLRINRDNYLSHIAVLQSIRILLCFELKAKKIAMRNELFFWLVYPSTNFNLSSCRSSWVSLDVAHDRTR